MEQESATSTGHHVHSLACAYLNQMEELKLRSRIADDIIARAEVEGPAISHWELMALQFRKMLELIAFASLAAHREQYTVLYTNYATHWNAKRLLRNLRSINADFYPKPIQLITDIEAELVQFDHISDGYLTEDDFVELYERASAALHTPNPFGPPREHTFGRSIGEWLDRIILLVRLHAIRLPTMGDYWIVSLGTPDEGTSRILTSIQVEK